MNSTKILSRLYGHGLASLMMTLVLVVGTGSGPALASTVYLDSETMTETERLSGELAKAGVGTDTVSLIDALAHHPDDRVRVQVAELLGLTQQTSAVGGLLRTAREDQGWNVRQAAAVALHQLDQPEGLKILEAELEAARGITMKLLLSSKLARLGNTAGFDTVKSYLASDQGSGLTLSTLYKFLRFDELRGEVEGLLLAAAESPNPEMRFYAIRGIADAHEDGYVPWTALEAALTRATEDPEQPNRDEAQRLLEEWRLIQKFPTTSTPTGSGEG